MESNKISEWYTSEACADADIANLMLELWEQRLREAASQLTCGNLERISKAAHTVVLPLKEFKYNDLHQLARQINQKPESSAANTLALALIKIADNMSNLNMNLTSKSNED